MLKVGLTGGIGSGKSEVSARLAAHGAVVIDADRIAREVVEPGTPGLAAVVAEFGEGVLLPGGGLDREKVGSIVFADPERLKALNSIVHPLVGERMQELMDAAPADAIVVYDVPLLAENGLAEFYDVVVVVDAPVPTQLDRLTARRGMTEEAARARIGAQATREQRRAVAHKVIDNSGSLAGLRARVDALWDELEAAAAARRG
ncbi:dephospho-CoA kinase [Actinomadura hibisca]|uniref:dephospho-CoA kinase n=1 Tax=Actinomadura hibisca TaxID=68565 RepID=UPI00082A91D9|nr:dephospho-CoA kinase [Actinomadura hibisca]